MDPRVKPEGDGRGMVPEGDGRGMMPEGDGRGMMPEGDGREMVPEGVGRGRVPEGDGRGMMPEGDGRGMVPEGDGKKCVLEGNFSLLSSLRARTRGQAIFELISNFLLSKEGKNKIGMTILFCLLSSTVHAECTPTPDCASIGYTSTSCEGGFVRCPFDISKLYCVPCDTKYKYTCSGTGQVGSGDSCNGKYIECECSGGGTFTNGKCQQNCTVGMIYYSDKSCSGSVIIGKTPIGVVVKDNELVMSNKVRSKVLWGTYEKDISALTNYNSATDAQTDYNGKSNTTAIVAEDSDALAAKCCNNYTTSDTSAGDWYLPAAGELYSYVYGNYNTINTTIAALGWNFGSKRLWSSSERGDTQSWMVYIGNGKITSTVKDSACSFPDIYCTINEEYIVSCFLDISI